MGWRDFFHLDTGKFALSVRKLSKKDLEEELQAQTRRMTSAGLGVAAGLGFAWSTSGISLLSGAVSGRCLWVAIQKFNILKDAWRNRCGAEYKIRKRDIVGPLAFGIALMLLGVDVGVVSSGGLTWGMDLIITLLASISQVMAEGLEMLANKVKRIASSVVGNRGGNPASAGISLFDFD
ncbi:hypothetical protein FRB97_001032 [Tulasnella sp. 331]|nr:hypothetical protein FRB97_001032 [Tulasnella sp. 331]